MVMQWSRDYLRRVQQQLDEERKQLAERQWRAKQGPEITEADVVNFGTSLGIPQLKPLRVEDGIGTIVQEARGTPPYDDPILRARPPQKRDERTRDPADESDPPGAILPRLGKEPLPGRTPAIDWNEIYPPAAVPVPGLVHPRLGEELLPGGAPSIDWDEIFPPVAAPPNTTVVPKTTRRNETVVPKTPQGNETIVAKTTAGPQRPSSRTTLFPKGETPYEPPSYAWPETRRAALDNFGQDAARVGREFIEAMRTRPGESAKAFGKIILGRLQWAIPGEQEYESKYANPQIRKLLMDFGFTYGPEGWNLDEEQLKRKLAERPAQSLRELLLWI